MFCYLLTVVGCVSLYSLISIIKIGRKKFIVCKSNKKQVILLVANKGSVITTIFKSNMITGPCELLGLSQYIVYNSQDITVYRNKKHTIYAYGDIYEENNEVMINALYISPGDKDIFRKKVNQKIKTTKLYHALIISISLFVLVSFKLATELNLNPI